MSAVAASTSFSTMVYDRIVKNSLSDEPSVKIYQNKILASTGDDMDIIKLVAAKGAMISLLCLAVTETTAKVALGIFSYAFSLMTFFIPPVSNRFYVLAKDLLGNLYPSTRAINMSIFFFFFGRHGIIRSEDGLYGAIICNPLSWRVGRSLNNGPLNLGIFDTKVVTILKNVAYKIGRLGIIAFAPIEWVSRASLALVAYSFHLISTPIEWVIEKPFSNLYYRAEPSMPISRMFYRLSYDLFYYNYDVGYSWVQAVYNFLLVRNQLTKGLLD